MTRSRLPNGSGTVYRGTSDDRWHVRVSMGPDPTGTPKRVHRTAATEREAQKILNELRDQRARGETAGSRKSMTVEDWLQHWLDDIAIDRVRESTLAGYRSKIARINAGLGKRRLDQLSPQHVQTFYGSLRREGLSGSTVRHVHRILGRALKVAVQQGHLHASPLDRLDAPTVKEFEATPLTVEETRKVLAAAADQRHVPRWTLALVLGLRQGEALGLHWADVDLDRGQLTVRTTLQRIPGKGLVMSEPKSRAGRRTLPLPGDLAAQLRRHRKQQQEERLAAGSTWRDNGLVFAQVTGAPVDPRSDWAAWKALLRRAEVREVRLHDARHTAATRMLDSDVQQLVAMRILGHESPVMTNRYQRVSVEVMRASLDRATPEQSPVSDESRS